MIKINKISEPFIYCCQKVIPLAFDESMSYYECLCNLRYKVKEVIDELNSQGLAIEELQEKYLILVDYVEHYFDNLDIQEEINNKLDEMAESGELTDIIAQYLELAGILSYNTVNELKEANNVANGSICKTLGFYEINDEGGAIYKITDTESIDDYQIQLDNGLYATLILNEIINVKQFGAYGDDEHDDSIAINNAIDYANGRKIIFKKGTYLCNINTTKSFNIDFNNSLLKPYNEGMVIRVHGSKTASGYILSNNLSRYDKNITLTSNPSNIEVGDFILIRDDSVRYTDNAPDINQEVHQVASINDNVITITDFIRYKKDIATSTYNVYKLNMLSDFTIENLKLDLQDSNYSGIDFEMVKNIKINNVSSVNSYGAVIGITSCYNTEISNVDLKDPRDVTAGKGYGIIICQGSNRFKVNYGKGEKLRHFTVLATSFDGYISNINVYDMQQCAFEFAHNSYGSDITYENCNAYNQTWYAFVYDFQGVSAGARQDNIAYNCNIINSNITMSTIANYYGGIYYGHPAKDSIIKDIKITSYEKKGFGIRVFPVNNNIFINNCFLNNLEIGLQAEETLYSNVTNLGSIICNNIEFDNCTYCYRIGNCTTFKCDNSVATNSDDFFTLGAYDGTKYGQLRELTIVNSLLKNNTRMMRRLSSEENIYSSNGVFGKIENNTIDGSAKPFNLVLTENGKITQNLNEMYGTFPYPNEMIFPISSASAITLSQFAIDFAICEFTKCCVKNIGSYNITIPNSNLMDNNGSNLVLEPGKTVTYLFYGSKWHIVQ